MTEVAIVSCVKTVKHTAHTFLAVPFLSNQRAFSSGEEKVKALEALEKELCSGKPLGFLSAQILVEGDKMERKIPRPGAWQCVSFPTESSQPKV